MSNKFEIQAEHRNDMGKGASRRLRHDDKVPAIVYGGGQEAVSLALDHKKILHALANEAFYSHILSLSINGKNEQVILKDVQRHPAKPRVMHMDFQRVRADEKLHMNIPLHFIGADVAPGLKEGGVISHLMSDVEISCFPADLPEFIEVDVSNLALDQTIHLTELKLPKGVELVAFKHGVEGHDLPVVSMHIPKVIEEEPLPTTEAAPAEGGEAAAPAAEGAAPAPATTADKGEKKE